MTIAARRSRARAGRRPVRLLVLGLLLVAACVLAIVFVRGLYKHGKAS